MFHSYLNSAFLCHCASILLPFVPFSSVDGCRRAKEYGWSVCSWCRIYSNLLKTSTRQFGSRIWKQFKINIPRRTQSSTFWIPEYLFETCRFTPPEIWSHHWKFRCSRVGSVTEFGVCQCASATRAKHWKSEITDLSTRCRHQLYWNVGFFSFFLKKFGFSYWLCP